MRSAALAATLGFVIAACGAARGADEAQTTASRAPAARTTLPQQTIAVPTDAAGKPVVMVWMGEHYFSPQTLTIPVGTTVLWRMLGQQEHDVWARDGSFHSPTMGPGATFMHTFSKAGAFPYFCAPHHGDGMLGEVVVK